MVLSISSPITGKWIASIFLMLIVAFPLAPNAVWAQANDVPSLGDPPLLFVYEDDRTLERQLRSYLFSAHRMDAKIRAVADNSEDEYVLIDNEGHTFQLWIDTQKSGRTSNDGTITGVSIKIEGRLETSFSTQKQRDQALILINEHMRKSWSPQRLFLTGGGDIVCQWNINVMEDAPVHAGQVYDAVRRTFSSMTQQFIPALKAKGLIN